MQRLMHDHVVYKVIKNQYGNSTSLLTEVKFVDASFAEDVAVVIVVFQIKFHLAVKVLNVQSIYINCISTWKVVEQNLLHILHKQIPKKAFA